MKSLFNFTKTLYYTGQCENGGNVKKISSVSSVFREKMEEKEEMEDNSDV